MKHPLMPDYRRAWHPGGTYFFTVNLLRCHDNNLLIRHIDSLRDAVCQVRHAHPFEIHGWAVLLVFLIWIYLSWTVILLGAVVTAAFPGWSRTAPPAGGAPVAPETTGVTDIGVL